MNNKSALVTGASRGIGRATAFKLAKNGYDIIVTCRENEGMLNSLAEETRMYGAKCLTITGNISDFSSGQELFKRINYSGLTPNLIINNAGISLVGLIQDITEEQWNTLWNTNVTSVISICKNAVPMLLANGGGKIINVSSVWGVAGASMETAYSATKGAVNSFTKALAKELAPSNIQVNAIACGIIDTDMNRHLTNEELDDIIKEIPANRIGTPEEIADIIFNIATAPGYMTGQIITVDGGWT